MFNSIESEQNCIQIDLNKPSKHTNQSIVRFFLLIN